MFAWAYYGLNVSGWARERLGKDREWRANTVTTHRTHALWRLGSWGLVKGQLVWRTLWRYPTDFRRKIPALIPTRMEGSMGDVITPNGFLLVSPQILNSRLRATFERDAFFTEICIPGMSWAFRVVPAPCRG